MARKTDLPEIPLCNGCGACCGPVTARPEEVRRIRSYIRENDIVWQSHPVEPGSIDLRCGFLRPQDDGSFTCAVHEVRPWTCRAFGVIKEMPCHLFPEAAVASVPAKQATLLRLVDPADKYLGEYFEAGYLKRIGGREMGRMMHRLATGAIKASGAGAQPEPSS